jgi:hypothetical protein
MLTKCMGPKLAINLLAFGVGGTLLLLFESIASGGDNAGFIIIPVAMAVVGGVRIWQLRAQRK